MNTADRLQLQVLLAQAITLRLREDIVEEVIPKPTISELEKMIDDGKEIGTMLPSGEFMRSRPKAVFAKDLADAVLSAIESSGFKIVTDNEKISRPGDEPLAYWMY